MYEKIPMAIFSSEGPDQPVHPCSLSMTSVSEDILFSVPTVIILSIGKY